MAQQGGGLSVVVANASDVTLSSLQIINNRTQSGNGGGIYVENGDLFSAPGDFTLQDSKVSGNIARSNIFSLTFGGFGGGVFLHSWFDVGAAGSTQFVRNDISYNQANAEGGGLFFDLQDYRDSDPSNPTMQVDVIDSTIHHNIAYSNDGVASNSGQTHGGGGLCVATSGKFRTVITNSTVSTNRATNGGGVYITGESAPNEPGSSVEIRHSTITGNIAGPFDPNVYPNTADDGYSPSVGGGITVAKVTYVPPTVLLDHTIVAGNVHQQRESTHIDHSDEPLNRSPDIALDPYPAALPPGEINHLEPEPLEPESFYYQYFTFLANFAFIGDVGAHFALNLIAIDGGYSEGDPVLGPLTNNGGPTLTHMPQLGSPVIDGGSSAFSPPPANDQRGFSRVFNGIIDIGAVEVQPTDPPCNIVGDYNRNGTVDAADYVVWREYLGTDFQLPNEDPETTPGEVTDEDYLVWRSHFGETCEEESHATVVVAPAAEQKLQPGKAVSNEVEIVTTEQNDVLIDTINPSPTDSIFSTFDSVTMASQSTTEVKRNTFRASDTTNTHVGALKQSLLASIRVANASIRAQTDLPIETRRGFYDADTAMNRPAHSIKLENDIVDSAINEIFP